MKWLLPIALVLVVALIGAAIHFAFMRWMARHSEPAPDRVADPPEST